MKDETVGRLLAVGDIHGCRQQLQELLAQVEPAQEDEIIFLGDYIDRGPDSHGVIEDLLDFQKRFPRSVFLKGNHEAMLLNYLKDKDRISFLLNGGQQTLDSYQQGSGMTIPEEHREFLENLALYHETEDFIFVHAGLRPGISLEDQSEEDLLWIRGDFLYSTYDWKKTVVFGHTPQKGGPLIQPGKIGLDTGAVYGNTLTCCEVRQERCWSVPEAPSKRRKFLFFF